MNARIPSSQTWISLRSFLPQCSPVSLQMTIILLAVCYFAIAATYMIQRALHLFPIPENSEPYGTDISAFGCVIVGVALWRLTSWSRTLTEWLLSMWVVGGGLVGCILLTILAHAKSSVVEPAGIIASAIVAYWVVRCLRKYKQLFRRTLW